MIMLAKCVDMISLAGRFQCQQLEFAIVPLSGFAREAKPPMVFLSCPFALAYVSKLLHLGIIGECLKECPFSVVRCPKKLWRIFSRHQFLCAPINSPFLYNFLE
jgi:hypothetical protein